jgi:hypothetical protein
LYEYAAGTGCVIFVRVTVWKLLLIVHLGTCHLYLWKISIIQTILQWLKIASIDDFEKMINDVSKRLGNFTNFLVSDHGVKKTDSVERKSAGKFQTHHDHVCDPEKENVTTSLQKRCRIKGLSRRVSCRVIFCTFRLTELAHSQSEIVSISSIELKRSPLPS